MATAGRPEGVPDDAVVIPPGVTQGDTLASIKKQVMQQNTRAIIDFAIDLQTWAINAQMYYGNNMPVPPIPRVPPREVLHVLYADVSGEPVTTEEGLEEDFYAWAWQTSDEAWFAQPKQ
jgi:hypothetical protein